MFRSIKQPLKKPGIYVEEIASQPKPIEGVSTSTTAFLGETQIGSTTPTLVTSWVEFQRLFGSYFGADKYLPYNVEGFFLNGGQRCYVRKVVNNDYAVALAELERLDEVAIVYSPNAQSVSGLADLLIDHCERLRSRFAIVDSVKGQDPSSVTKPRHESSFAALYYPWIQVKEEKTDKVCLVPPGGHVAGVYARNDRERGVHKAPANVPIKGVAGFEFAINSRQQDNLNFEQVNTIRAFTGRGIMVWGARTLSADLETRYVSVRRLLIYLEQSIKKGTAWAVFEPNNEATWAKVKGAVENFLTLAWRDGMLVGAKQQEAYFVKCDRSIMTQNDIDNGRLIIHVGIAAVKPAEFMILRISQTMVQQ